MREARTLRGKYSSSSDVKSAATIPLRICWKAGFGGAGRLPLSSISGLIVEPSITSSE